MTYKSVGTYVGSISIFTWVPRETKSETRRVVLALHY
jgi:hypothetical protein